MKIRENFRVVAHIDERYSHGLDTKALDKFRSGEANDLLKQVKRHCDAERASVEWDVVCSHCGRAWEEDPATKEPVCCNAAQAEFSAAKVSA